MPGGLLELRCLSVGRRFKSTVAWGFRPPSHTHIWDRALHADKHKGTSRKSLEICVRVASFRRRNSVCQTFGDYRGFTIDKAKRTLGYSWIPRYPYTVSYCSEDDRLTEVIPCLVHGMPTDEWLLLAAAAVWSVRTPFGWSFTLFGCVLILLLEATGVLSKLFPHTISPTHTPPPCHRRNIVSLSVTEDRDSQPLVLFLNEPVGGARYLAFVDPPRTVSPHPFKSSFPSEHCGFWEQTTSL